MNTPLRSGLSSSLHSSLHSQAVFDFLPSDLTGLKLWTRFNSGIIETGSGVSQWTDISGLDNHLLQAVDLDRPQKQADGSILADGIRQFLKAATFTWGQPETIYLLAKHVTWTSGDTLFDGNTGNSGRLYQTGVTPNIELYAGAAAAGNTGLILDTYSVVTVVFNGASSSIKIDDGTPTTGNAGTASMSGFSLAVFGGGTAWAHAQYKEVIGYAGVHDAATQAQVINYLAGVGGLSI